MFGKKKTSIAVAICKRGVGLIKVNGQPLAQLQPEILCQSTSISQTALFFPKSYGSIPLKCRTRLKKCAVLRSLPYDLNTNPTTFPPPIYLFASMRSHAHASHSTHGETARSARSKSGHPVCLLVPCPRQPAAMMPP